MFYKDQWIQNAMNYYRLWVITVWVISGLTVAEEAYGAASTRGRFSTGSGVLLLVMTTKCEKEQRG